MYIGASVARYMYVYDDNIHNVIYITVHSLMEIPTLCTQENKIFRINQSIKSNLYSAICRKLIRGATSGIKYCLHRTSEYNSVSKSYQYQ